MKKPKSIEAVTPMFMERTGSPPKRIYSSPEHSASRPPPKEIKMSTCQRTTMPANVTFSHDGSQSHNVTIAAPRATSASVGVKKTNTIGAPGNTKIHLKRPASTIDAGGDSDATAEDRNQQTRKVMTPKRPQVPQVLKGQSFSGPPVNLGMDDLKSFSNPTKARQSPDGGAFGQYSGDRGNDDSDSEGEFSEGTGSQGSSSGESGDHSVAETDDMSAEGEYSGAPQQGAYGEANMGQSDMPTKQMSSSERRQLKYDLLSKIQALERKGVQVSKKFTSKHKLVHIQAEYNRLSQILANEAGVKFGRKLLMGFVGVTEWMNNRFDPVGAKLEGWSESVMENIEDFDHSLERIVAKWTSHVEVAPEMELMTALAGSAFMFHMSKSILSNPASILGAMGSQKPDMMENMLKKMMGGVTGNGGKNALDTGDDDDDSDDGMSPPSMNLNPLSSQQQGGVATRGSGAYRKPSGGESSDSEGSEYSEGSSGSETDASSASSEEAKPRARMVSIPKIKAPRGKGKR